MNWNPCVKCLIQSNTKRGCSLQWFQFTWYQKGTKTVKKVEWEHSWAAEDTAKDLSKTWIPQFVSCIQWLGTRVAGVTLVWNNTQGHLNKTTKAQIKMQLWEKLMLLPLNWIWGMVALLCGRSGIQTAQLLHPQLLSLIYTRVKFLNKKP